MRPRPARPGRALAALLALGLVVGACGDDDDPEDDAGDEATFCRLAVESDPVAEATAPVLARLEELAPEEVADDVAVLRDLADRLAELDDDDPEALAVEFEVRFSDEHVAARVAVDDYIESECPAETTSPSSVTTSSSVEDADRGDDG